LPASPKYVIDRVIGQHRPELLLPLALATGAATLVQAMTGFGLSQILGVAAQRAITDMRRTVQAYVLRLPVSYFDSTKSGILISRIMSDAEGIRNLVGTGLVQLVGGLLSGAVALVVLLLINIASIGTQITEAFAGLDRIQEIRKLVTEDSEDAARAAVGDVRGDVVFEDVSFAYESGKDVLQRVSFHAPPGSTTAL